MPTWLHDHTELLARLAYLFFLVLQSIMGSLSPSKELHS